MDTARFSQRDPARSGGAAPSHRPGHQGPTDTPGSMCKTILHRFTIPRWKRSKSLPPNLSRWVDLVRLGVCSKRTCHVELVVRSSSIHRAVLNTGEQCSPGVCGRNVLVITTGQSWRTCCDVYWGEAGMWGMLFDTPRYSHPQVIWPDSLKVEKPGCEAKMVLVSKSTMCGNADPWRTPAASDGEQVSESRPRAAGAPRDWQASLTRPYTVRQAGPVNFLRVSVLQSPEDAVENQRSRKD